ncbi:hypothetical protein [Microbacterium foliorum]|uniref:hypothetical protein n=1 Tax=Microbacterium foliorum TaxID=104336 RepID=UPI0028D3D5C8|nr:hypothetical protein [Microbacterium foliorum]
MMPEEAGSTSRVHINLSSGELDIRGSEEFVSQYADSIEDLLQRLRTEPIPAAAPVAPVLGSPDLASIETSKVAQPSTRLEPFGEALHTLASKSGTDQILLAGYYVSEASGDGTFATAEANKLLIEQGIKLSNASQSLKNVLAAKRVFKVGSRYKVARSGIDFLKSMGVAA